MKISDTNDRLKIDFSGNLIISNKDYLIDVQDTNCKIDIHNGHFIFNDKTHSSLYASLEFLGYSKNQAKLFKILCWFLRKPINGNKFSNFPIKSNADENQN